jgi:hypothetical protein
MSWLPAKIAVSSEEVMSDQANLEQRLAALERAVADLQRRLASAPAADNWLEKVTGSISDETAFLEALEFGRAFRSADRPSDEPGAQP